jgi:hypothetical protein
VKISEKICGEIAKPQNWQNCEAKMFKNVEKSLYCKYPYCYSINFMQLGGDTYVAKLQFFNDHPINVRVTMKKDGFELKEA